MANEECCFFASSPPADVEAEIDSLTVKDVGRPNAVVTFATVTPDIFILLGLKQLPVVAYRDKLARGLFHGKGQRHGHSDGLTKGIIKGIASMLASPLYVFKSSTVEDALIAVYPILDKNGNPVMVSVEQSIGAAQNIEVNLITSIYGRLQSQYQGWTNDGKLVYWDDLNKNKAALSVRLQSPSDVTASVNNVLCKSEICQALCDNEECHSYLEGQVGLDKS